MARTYDESVLPLLDPGNLAWARTWVRALLRDRPEVEQGGFPSGPGQPVRPSVATWPEYSRTDAELDAALALDAARDATGTLTFYRPHFTAARLYLGDPQLWKSRSVDGASESRREPREIIAAWLAQGRQIDTLIPVTPLPPFEATEAQQLAERAPRIASLWIKAPGGW